MQWLQKIGENDEDRKMLCRKKDKIIYVHKKYIVK